MTDLIKKNNSTEDILAAKILDISFKHRLGHVGSCLTALPIIFNVYSQKKPEDKVVLSAGHSGLALYVVLEHFGLIKSAEEKLLTDGIHPTRGDGIDASTGSLGQGVTIGVGFALSKLDREVYVISTDGEIAEGSFWESLFFAYQRPINNLQIIINDNGYSALRKTSYLEGILEQFDVKVVDTSQIFRKFIYSEWLYGLEGHYHVMTKEEYQLLRRQYIGYYE